MLLLVMTAQLYDFQRPLRRRSLQQLRDRGVDVLAIGKNFRERRPCEQATQGPRLASTH
jgi:hypothetical protein